MRRFGDTYWQLQQNGVPASVSSVASGLVYPGVGPEVAMLHEQGRISVTAISDDEVIGTFFRISSVDYRTNLTRFSVSDGSAHTARRCFRSTP